MRVHLRETGSITVQARKSDVLDVLKKLMAEGAYVAPDRIVGVGSTYIIRERPDGTHVIHARSESSALALAAREREDLRRAVQTDLFHLQAVLANRDE